VLLALGHRAQRALQLDVARQRGLGEQLGGAPPIGLVEAGRARG
jgi:hypothetical protein